MTKFEKSVLEALETAHGLKMSVTTLQEFLEYIEDEDLSIEEVACQIADVATIGSSDKEIQDCIQEMLERGLIAVLQ